MREQDQKVDKFNVQRYIDIYKEDESSEEDTSSVASPPSYIHPPNTHLSPSQSVYVHPSVDVQSSQSVDVQPWKSVYVQPCKSVYVQRSSPSVVRETAKTERNTVSLSPHHTHTHTHKIPPTHHTADSEEEDDEFSISHLYHHTHAHHTQQHKLPPPDQVLASADLKFKEFAERSKKSAKNLIKNPQKNINKDEEISTDGKFVLPSITWHVPLTSLDDKRNQPQPSKQGGSNLSEEDINSKRKLNIKEKEKLKRSKGQSTHTSWKPEEWMKLRQHFD